MNYFKVEEMACKDGSPYPAGKIVDGTWPKLRETLNVIREAWGAPIRVVSGYRSPDYNVKVNGAKASQHMLGTAADIKPGEPHGSARALHTMIVSLHAAGKLPHLGGIGEYSTFVHVDVRPRKANGSLYRWSGKSLRD